MKSIRQKKPYPRYRSGRILAFAGMTISASLLLMTACADTASTPHLYQFIVRQQLEQCWNVPVAGGLTPVEAVLDLNANGQITKMDIVDKQSYAGDPAFRAMADSVLRIAANPRCPPVNGLPADKYDQWKRIDLTFDPRDML